MIGVTGSGKTSLIKAISGEIMGEEGYQNPIPTYGFDIKNIQFEDQLLNVWDIGGSQEQTLYWSTYLDNVDAIIYVIDGSSKERLEEAGVALLLFLEEPIMQESLNVPLLIFNNKCESKDAISNEFLISELGLKDLDQTERPWNIIQTSAKTGEGLVKGFTWIKQTLRD